MNEAVRRSLLLRAAAMWIVFAVQQGCGNNQSQTLPVGTAISWDSPKMRQIKDEWQSLQQTYDWNPEKIPGERGKEKYGNLLKMCDRLFRKRLTDGELRQLADSCDMLPMRAADREFFDNEVLGFMVKAFVASGDRESLVKLLSTRRISCVSAGWPTAIEFYLACAGGRNLGFRRVMLKDPILVLGEAYSKCSVPEVRQEIAFAVRRGFGGLGISGKDDADFVSNAMQWYEKERDHVIVNSYYGQIEQMFPVEMFHGTPQEYDELLSRGGRRKLLFEEKPPGASRAEQFGLLRPILPIWLMHAGIAAVLSAPIVFFGRKRVRWNLWELLAMVLPFAVWASLMASDLADDRKTVWNLEEQFYFMAAVPMAAIVRVAVGSRRAERVWAAALVVALCVVAAAVFFIVPPLRGEF